VAAIAANAVASAHGTVTGAKGGAASSSIGDIFAAMLDEIAQDFGAAGDTVPAASAGDGTLTPGDANAQPTGDTASSPAATTLRQALDDLRARLSPGDRGGDPDKAAASDDPHPAARNADRDHAALAQFLALHQPAPAVPIQPLKTVAAPSPAPCDPAANEAMPAAGAGPAAQAPVSGNPVPAAAPALRPAADTDADESTDTSPVPAVPAQTGTTASDADDTSAPQAPVVPAQLAGTIAAPATDTTASPMTAAGAARKPARPASAATDSTKTQTQRSTAAALAAASTAVGRVFTDQQASSTQALPLHGSIDDDKAAASGGSGSAAPDHPAPAQASPAPSPAPAPAAQPAAAPAAAPAQLHPAPQADVTGATAPAQVQGAPVPAAPHAPASVSAQLQILQSDPREATPNLAALAITVAARSQDGAKHFDIRLDPPELGRVDVRLTVDDAGKAQAALAVEKPQTLALLQKDSAHLERALKDAGLDLSQNGLNFSLKGQQQQGGSGGNAPAGRQRQLSVRAVIAADAAAPASSTAGVPSGDARLDIRV